MEKSPNVVWHPHLATREDRFRVTRALPTVVWLTGLSGCGKSTLAMALERELIARNHLAFVLDGDNVRHGLNKNLGFSNDDRQENIRRIGEVAKLFVSSGLLTITSFISPFRQDRANVRALLPAGEFIEIFVDAPLEVCESRDPKGLYKKARTALATGKGLEFTGIDSPYEPPLTPELHLHTDQQTPEQCVEKILTYLAQHGHLLTTNN